MRKIKKIQKRCLRITLNDYESDYETLLRNSNKLTMEIQRLRTLAVEIFKTLNEINPPYMKNIFTPKENSKLRQSDTIVKRINTSRFGTQNLRSLVPLNSSLCRVYNFFIFVYITDLLRARSSLKLRQL